MLIPSSKTGLRRIDFSVTSDPDKYPKPDSEGWINSWISQGPDSLLDADTLDGHEADEFAFAVNLEDYYTSGQVDILFQSYYNETEIDGMFDDLSSVYAPVSHTHAATDIASGTLDDARLSSNVVLLNASQVLTNKTLTSPAINTPTIVGGTINNAPIGGTTPAAGAFTTLSASTSVTILGANGTMTIQDSIFQTARATMFFNFTTPREINFNNGLTTLSATGALLIGGSLAGIALRDRSDPTTAAKAFTLYDTSNSFRIFGATAAADLLSIDSTGNLSSRPDTDATTILGRSRFDSSISDYAMWRHFDQTGANAYGLALSPAGATFINSASGQIVGLQVNGSTIVTIAGASVSITQPTTITNTAARPLAFLNGGAVAWSIGKGAATSDNFQLYSAAYAATVLDIGFSGAGNWTASDTVTNTVTNVITLQHNTNGTAAASFGTALAFQAETTTTSNIDMGRIRYLWTTATHASRMSTAIISVYNISTELDVLTLSPIGLSSTITLTSPTSPIVLNVVPTVNGVGTTSLGAYIDITAHPTSGTAPATTGIYGIARHGSSATVGVGALYGVRGGAVADVAQTVTLAVGVDGGINASRTGAIISVANGLRSQVVVNTGTTIGDAMGLRVVDGSGAGTITNQYGVKVEDQTKGGTLNYAFYSGLGLVRFGDNTTITRSTAATTLLVESTFSTGSALLNLKHGTGGNSFVTATGGGGLILDVAAASDIVMRPNFSTERWRLYADGRVGTSFEDATTGIISQLTMTRTTSGTPANSMGAQILMQLESSAATREAARIRWYWGEVTDASRSSTMAFTVYNIGTPVDVLTLTPTQANVNVPTLRFPFTGVDHVITSVNNVGSSSITDVFATGVLAISGIGGLTLSGSSQSVILLTSSTPRLTISSAGLFTVWDGGNFALGSSTGTKLGTATSQRLSLWNATPDVQPTTAIVAAAFVANTSGIVDDTATFGGYTLGQIVAALKRIGALA